MLGVEGCGTVYIYVYMLYVRLSWPCFGVLIFENSKKKYFPKLKFKKKKKIGSTTVFHLISNGP